MNANAGFVLYLLFVTSWFLHLTARIPLLGLVRFDLILVILVSIMIFFSDRSHVANNPSESHRVLKILFLYILVTLPFVEWPGSVVKNNLEPFVKAVVFYYFTVHLIRTERSLRTFMILFLALQTCRVLEPVYLHISEGYWGSIASMGDWESLNRLAGAPHDTVNPNCLAYIIAFAIALFQLPRPPFRYRRCAHQTVRWTAPLRRFAASVLKKISSPKEFPSG